MVGHQIIIKKHRHIAIDTNEIIALDFNESLNDIKIFLRGGSSLTIEGKKALKIWKLLSNTLPDLFQTETEEISIEDLA